MDSFLRKRLQRFMPSSKHTQKWSRGQLVSPAGEAAVARPGACVPGPRWEECSEPLDPPCCTRRAPQDQGLREPGPRSHPPGHLAPGPDSEREGRCGHPSGSAQYVKPRTLPSAHVPGEERQRSPALWAGRPGKPAHPAPTPGKGLWLVFPSAKLTQPRKRLFGCPPCRWGRPGPESPGGPGATSRGHARTPTPVCGPHVHGPPPESPRRGGRKTMR